MKQTSRNNVHLKSAQRLRCDTVCHILKNKRRSQNNSQQINKKANKNYCFFKELYHISFKGTKIMSVLYSRKLQVLNLFV